MALLYGRAGRLTAENVGFGPGQCNKCHATDPITFDDPDSAIMMFGREQLPVCR
jgi:hypothetical protein